MCMCAWNYICCLHFGTLATRKIFKFTQSIKAEVLPLSLYMCIQFMKSMCVWVYMFFLHTMYVCIYVPTYVKRKLFFHHLVIAAHNRICCCTTQFFLLLPEIILQCCIKCSLWFWRSRWWHWLHKINRKIVQPWCRRLARVMYRGRNMLVFPYCFRTLSKSK